MTSEHPTTEQQPQDVRGRPDDGRERPDLRGPRGNQQVDRVDVERGQEKIDRLLTK